MLRLLTKPFPLAFVLLTSTASIAFSQVSEESTLAESPEQTRDVVARAEALFLEARVHFDDGRFGEARESLEESLSLAPRPGTATNLARVLVQMRHALQAESLMRRVLNGDFGELNDEQLRSASDLLQITNEEIGAIQVTLSGAPTMTFQLNEEVAESYAEGDQVTRRMDPGTHTLRLSSGDGRRASSTVELLPGQRRTLRLSLEPMTPPVAETPRESRSLARSPWLWVGIIVGVAALGAGLYFALQPADADVDPVWGQAQGLSF